MIFRSQNIEVAFTKGIIPPPKQKKKEKKEACTKGEIKIHPKGVIVTLGAKHDVHIISSALHSLSSPLSLAHGQRYRHL